MIQFKKEDLMKDVIIHAQNTTAQDLDQKVLPTDIHIVEYEVEGNLYSDAVRAYKMSDIFDVYWDKLKPKGGTIISITSGYGNIKPNMYNTTKKDDKKEE